MDGLDVLKKQKPKKGIQKKRNKSTRSNILKFIITCLESELYSHMLQWEDKEKNEFVIKFVHMNNPDWKTADYLALFKGLDKLSSNHKKYLQDKKYEHKCKVRCKSNLRKLQERGAITYMGHTNLGKSIQLRKYKLNVDVTSIVKKISKDAKTTKSNNVNELNGCETVQGIAYNKGNFKTETQPNEQSHYLCLSKLSSANSAGHTLFNTCYTTENRNGDARNAFCSLIVYEHEKQMDGNDVTLENSPRQNSATHFMSCSGIEEKDNSKLIEYDKLFDQNIKENIEIENTRIENWNDETVTLTHLVPSSPSNFMDVKDPEWYEELDIDKPLQQDDPFLSSTVSESNSLFEGHEANFPLDFKGFYAFENLFWSDDG